MCKQIVPLRQGLDSWRLGLPAQDFAYPCDVTNLGSGGPNRQLKRFETLLKGEGIASARTSEGPPNSLAWAKHHPYLLEALAAGYDASTLDELIAFIRRAQTERRWAILVFHDVGPPDLSKGSISADLHDALPGVITRDRIPCKRVCDVIAALA